MAASAPESTGLTVVVTGAESSGKTTLARTLSERLGVPWVQEFARTYLSGRTGYGPEDLWQIAEGQHTAELAAAARHPLIVADTDLLVVRIWSQVRYGRRDPRIDARIDASRVSLRRRLYLVTRPEMPWEPDPLREHPHAREQLHALHLELLSELGLEHVEIAGTPEARVTAAQAAVEAAEGAHRSPRSPGRREPS
jgi:nicotinamide riboside kinase